MRHPLKSIGLRANLGISRGISPRPNCPGLPS